MKEAEALAAAGQEVRVFCPRDEIGGGVEVLNGVTYERLPTVRVGSFLGQGRVDRLARRSEQLGGSRLALRILAFGLVFRSLGPAAIRFRPDVVHAHDLSTLRAGRRVAHRANSRLVFDSHELALHVARRPPLVKRWYDAVVQRRFIGDADRVITVSESIADHLTLQYRIRRPSVIYNSPPAARQPFGRTVRRELGLPREVPLAVYIGSVGPQRGVDLCVAALDALPNLHLVILGPRRPEQEEGIRALALRRASADRLHILDPVPVDAIAEYLSDVDVSLLPIQDTCLNHSFCMPNKLFESVLAGLPVVVSDLVELRRFVAREGVGVVVGEPSPAGFAAAISTVLEKRTDFFPGDRLHQLRHEFGWEAQGQRLVNIYRRLLEDGPPTPTGPAIA